jgi:CRISPR-associated protein Csx1
MKILIATWGYPFAWQPTSYEFESIKKEHVRTTLPVLIDALKPDKVLVIGTDTVLYKENPTKECDSYTLEVENIISTLNQTPKNERYAALKNIAQDLIKEFIEAEVYPHIPQNFRNEEKIKVLINYNLGWYGYTNKCNKPICGFDLRERTPYDYYANIFYLIYKELKPLLNISDKLELYLDVTHGINYMPIFALKAIEWLASFISAEKEVNLTVINSEPIPQPYVKGIVLKIFKVLEKTYKGDFFSKHLPKEWIEGKPKKLSPEFEKLFGGKSKEYRPDVEPFLASFIYGIPLGIKEFLPNLQEIENFVDKKIQEYESSIEVKVNTSNKCLTVKAPQLYNPLPKYVLAAILTLFAQRIIKDKSQGCENFVTKIVEHFFEEPFKSILDRNIKTWKECNKNPSQKTCGGENCLDNSDEKANLRNLVSHSGLLHQCIDITKCSYSSNKAKVEKLLRKLLAEPR